MHPLPMSFEQASARADQLWDEARRCGRFLDSFPKGPMGLTPDRVKSTPEYRQAYEGFEKAKRDLQLFNNWYTKTFQKEIVQARRERYSQPVATT